MASIENKKDDETAGEEDVDVGYDELLTKAGFGTYQILLFIASFQFYMYGTFAYYTQIFITEVSQKYWCRIPELEHLTVEERISLGIPPDENNRFGISQCYAYVANWTEVLATGQTPTETWDTAPCQHGWEFDKTDIPYETITSELGWVCDKGNYQAIAQSIFFVGCIVGGFIFGWVADRFGRLKAAILSCIVVCIGGTSSIFASSLLEFSICRFITGLGYDNCMVMGYLLVLEFVAPRYRTILANLGFGIFYGLFCAVLPWIALACGYWKTIAIATSLPMLLVVLCPLLIPESPRWLLSKGRIDEAVNTALQIGRINKKVVPPKLVDQFRVSFSRKETEEESSWLEIMKSPVLRKTFLLMCVVYMCCGLVFDGLIRSLGQLDADFFISFSVVSATELPSLLLTAIILDWTGRRWLTAVVMLISGVTFVLILFVESTVASVALAASARFAANMSFSTVYQWSAEILPTAVRGSGVAIVHICGFIAAVISPYVVYLYVYVYWLPAVILGGICVIGAVSALALPETAYKPLPHTFNDAIELGKDQSLWDIPGLRNRRARNRESRE